MFLKTIVLYEVLNLSPLPVRVIQSLRGGIPAEPKEILRNLSPPPGRDVFQRFGIDYCFHGFSMILAYGSTLLRTLKLKSFHRRAGSGEEGSIGIDTFFEKP
jgi:hypothetical protein